MSIYWCMEGEVGDQTEFNQEEEEVEIEEGSMWSPCKVAKSTNRPLTHAHKRTQTG